MPTDTSFCLRHRNPGSTNQLVTVLLKGNGSLPQLRDSGVAEWHQTAWLRRGTSFLKSFCLVSPQTSNHRLERICSDAVGINRDATKACNHKTEILKPFSSSWSSQFYQSQWNSKFKFVPEVWKKQSDILRSACLCRQQQPWSPSSKCYWEKNQCNVWCDVSTF